MVSNERRVGSDCRLVDARVRSVREAASPRKWSGERSWWLVRMRSVRKHECPRSSMAGRARPAGGWHDCVQYAQQRPLVGARGNVRCLERVRSVRAWDECVQCARHREPARAGDILVRNGPRRARPNPTPPQTNMLPTTAHTAAAGAGAQQQQTPRATLHHTTSNQAPPLHCPPHASHTPPPPPPRPGPPRLLARGRAHCNTASPVTEPRIRSDFMSLLSAAVHLCRCAESRRV